MTIKIISISTPQLRTRFVGVVYCNGRAVATTHQSFNNRNSAAYAAWQIAKHIN